MQHVLHLQRASTQVESLHQELKADRLKGPTSVTLGVFDGVHLGHQHLIQELCNISLREETASAVITFLNHPLSVLRPNIQLSLLMTTEERLTTLRGTGVDHVIALTFSRDLSLLSAERFALILKRDLGMTHLVVGPDFAMGRNRGGTISVLQQLGMQHQFNVTAVDTFKLNGRNVNSTEVRNALANGEVELAGEYLGRPFRLTGRVEHGEARGSTLGFPTANIRPDEILAIPNDGIYAAWIHTGEAYYLSAVSIGIKPTFHNSGSREIEAYVLDFDGDLYGRTVSLEFAFRIRQQQRFANSADLVNQMDKDVTKVRKLLNSSPISRLAT